jgi:hypothetical protein
VAALHASLSFIRSQAIRIFVTLTGDVSAKSALVMMSRYHCEKFVERGVIAACAV